MREFDSAPNRRNTGSKKWDSVPSTSLPMWLADMDFKTPKPILDTLHCLLDHGVLGYPIIKETYYKACINWFFEQYQLTVDQNNITPVIGVIPAIRAIIEALSNESDSIIIQPPVYDVFLALTRESQRHVLYNPLHVVENGHYSINFAQLEQCLMKKPKLLLLCSPHNPVGRVWSQTELFKVCSLCHAYGTYIVVDEIHSDLTMPGVKFHSAGNMPKKFLSKIILLNSPTKTFNIAGLRGGNVITFCDKLKAYIETQFVRQTINKVNAFYLEATTAAYTQCLPWLQSLRKYLSQNQRIVTNHFLDLFPQIQTTPLEATYLMWFNYKMLCFSENELLKRTEPLITISPGSIFGEQGNGYFRLNIACPKNSLAKGLNLLKDALF